MEIAYDDEWSTLESATRKAAMSWLFRTCAMNLVPIIGVQDWTTLRQWYSTIVTDWKDIFVDWYAHLLFFAA